MKKKKIKPAEKGVRTCLRCSKSFNSTGAGNRICPNCTFANRSAVYGPITRGEKRHRGETISTKV